MQKHFDVCAVVVTYNRLDLLKECITELLNQTYKLNRILVIDNNSSDGTVSFLEKEYPNIDILKLEKNIGGAGGFYEGIKRAYELGHEWIWILDDDTIPTKNALMEMVETYKEMPQEKKPVALASKVLWTDDNLHTMNYPNLKKGSVDEYVLSLKYQALPLRSSSFVSFLLNSEMITKYGLPIKEYFIWNDDTEYTSRILKHEFGVFVPESTVYHKTKTNYTPMESAGERFYYEVRNKLWFIRTDSLTSKEKIIMLLKILTTNLSYLKFNKFKIKNINIVLKGIVDGIFKFKPTKNEYM